MRSRRSPNPLMFLRRTAAQGRRKTTFLAAVVFAAISIAVFGFGNSSCGADADLILRIYDWKTGVVYVEAPAKVGDRLFFGWIHSLEKIPWNEYYHIDEDLNLILDAITFPAFGAGIPENKGRVCYIEDGLIHMEEIDQLFKELDWLNSHTATQEILLEKKHVTRGSDLPQHTRLRLVIERGEANGQQQK